MQIEDKFLVQIGEFCVHEYKIRACQKLYISPYPQIAIVILI